MPWRTVGETAGLVYQFLQKNKEATPTGLIKSLKIPYDTLQMAIGWLAREDKITIQKDRATLRISLK